MAAPAYNYNTSPTAIQAVNSEGLFTAWQLAADIPQVRKQLMVRHNYTKNFYHTLRELGLGSALIGPTIAHWEEDWIINNFVVGTIVTPSTGPGTNVTFSLDTTSMYTNTMPGNVTGTFSYLAENDIIQLIDGSQVQVIKGGVNMAVNPFQITVRPSLAANDIATKLVAGGRYWIPTNAYGEGTFGAKPKTPRVFRWSNNTQIVKSAFSETGTSATNKLPFVNIEGQEGSLMILGADATDRLQFQRVGGALFFGKQSDNLTSLSDSTGFNVPNKTTQGFDDYVSTYGNILPYSAGSFDLDDFDAITEIFNRERIGTKNIIMQVAFNLDAQINNTLKDYMDNTCFEYAANSWPYKPNIGPMVEQMDSPKDFFLWLDFAGIRKNSYNIIKKHQFELDDVQEAGTTGYPWPNTGYAGPIISYKNPDGDDGWSPSIGYKYKALNGYNREMSIAWTGGAPIKHTPTNSLDAYQMDVLSEIAGDWGLGNQWVKISPQ
jgi:hypothetical protein